jgi:ribulose-5-phosphate 4-epimerase/fuculose-1-phosphate aldolase
MTDAETQTRLELAAAYRLMAHFGFGELANNHLAARVPDEPDAFLIKPSELFFEEVTASTLVKYDLHGRPLTPGAPPLTGPPLIIHGGIFAARPEIGATIHSHGTAMVGVSAQRPGLLPISQHATMFVGRIGYLEYTGLETTRDQQRAIVDVLHGKDVALLRNHGALVIGQTIGGAMTCHYKLDLACKAQLAALTGGGDVVLISDEVMRKTQSQIAERPYFGGGRGGLNWTGMLRLADRQFPAYRD